MSEKPVLLTDNFVQQEQPELEHICDHCIYAWICPENQVHCENCINNPDINRNA